MRDTRTKSAKRETLKNLFFWMVAALTIFAFWSVSSRIQKNERSLSFSDFMTQLERGNIAKVTVTETATGIQIVGEFKNGQSIRTFAPPQVDNLVNLMLDQEVEVTARDANSSSWLGHIISWTPIVIMIAFLIFFMRAMQSSNPEVSPAISLSQGKEKRLEIKACVLHHLLVGKSDLSEDEIISLLTDSGIPDHGEVEVRKALYEMLSDGTIVTTEHKTYRLRTTP